MLALVSRWQRFWARRRLPAPRRFRYERFGGIVQLRWPQALVFIDRDRARHLGHTAPPPGLWPEAETTDAAGGRLAAQYEVPDEATGPLSAPLEAHLQLTNRCSAGCRGCYTGATPEGGPREWGLFEWQRALSELAAAGVFHVALGGGESAELPWLGDLLHYARAQGLVPNLTTSGLYDDAVLRRLCDWAAQGLFGQINVSLDGIGDDYAAVRGFDGFARADRALIALRAVQHNVGINCVVTRRSFPGLPALFAHARRRRLREVELLRFKPAGRGARRDTYDELRCTDAQHRALLPTLLQLSRRHRVRVRVDCSFTPMLAHHQPPPELLRFLAVYGCAGGDLLIAARAAGQLAACSFAPSVQPSAAELRTYWQDPAAFAPFRSWPQAQEPCKSCQYLSLCRGGCRVVSAHVSGDARDPDPECPRVLDYRAAQSSANQVNNGLDSRAPAVPGSPAEVSATPTGELDLMTQRAKRHLKVLG
jgi:radical SAM protein with 4Fe4S-binding SPASM domain